MDWLAPARHAMTIAVAARTRSHLDIFPGWATRPRLKSPVAFARRCQLQGPRRSLPSGNTPARFSAGTLLAVWSPKRLRQQL